MKLHTAINLFKLLGALALIGLPLLLLAGCQTGPTVVAPAPIPITQEKAKGERQKAKVEPAAPTQRSTPQLSTSVSPPVGLFALSRPLRVVTEKGHQPRDGVALAAGSGQRTAVSGQQSAVSSQPAPRSARSTLNSPTLN